MFENKFLGVPDKREGDKTDYKRGKNYKQNIIETYKIYGLEPDKIQRIFVCWITHPEAPVDDFLKDFKQRHDIEIKVLGFRNHILPELLNEVGTANYEDEVLRMIGLFKQRDEQMKSERCKENIKLRRTLNEEMKNTKDEKKHAMIREQIRALREEYRKDSKRGIKRVALTRSWQR